MGSGAEQGSYSKVISKSFKDNQQEWNSRSGKNDQREENKS